MNGKTKRYADLIDGVLELANTGLSSEDYTALLDELKRELVFPKQCPMAAPGIPCTYAHRHHGPHSWEKTDPQTASMCAGRGSFWCARVGCRAKGVVPTPGEICLGCQQEMARNTREHANVPSGKAMLLDGPAPTPAQVAHLRNAVLEEVARDIEALNACIVDSAAVARTLRNLKRGPK